MMMSHEIKSEEHQEMHRSQVYRQGTAQTKNIQKMIKWVYESMVNIKQVQGAPASWPCGDTHDGGVQQNPLRRGELFELPLPLQLSKLQSQHKTMGQQGIRSCGSCKSGGLAAPL
jgi:hypothetical protein